jgi:hypothetical protein
VLQQLIVAVNRNDVDAMAALVTDDVVFIGGPCGGAPGGVCVGKEQFRQAAAEGPAQVTVSDVQVAGDTVRFRTEERFDLPPEAAAAGIQRFVEVGSIVVQDGKIARAGLVPDVSDQQTIALLRIFASEGPPPGLESLPIANDGQTLATQPAATQLRFLNAYGDQAAQKWVDEHNAALARQGH